MNFDFDLQKRTELINLVVQRVDAYYDNTKKYPTTPNLDIEEIRTFINQSDFNNPANYEVIINHITDGLEKYSVHTPHPKYFGLFNPRSNYAGMLADLITAAYNPQLAAWSHAPFAAEVEAKVINELAMKFGYKPTNSDGVFTTGGAEANLTAILCAINHKYPQFAKEGVFGIPKKPIIFCSEEAHHSIQKAVKVVGLGYESVKSIPVGQDLKLDIEVLKKELDEIDRINHEPLMIIGTAGTTGTGTIDDLRGIGEICQSHKIWFHVDAAYGGACVLSKKLKSNLKGIENSDSITFDAHKWMSVPMGTSVFLTSHSAILGKTFRIATEYMPKEAAEMEIVEPFTHSIQWSRRFNGLKVYLALLLYGWSGYDKTITKQSEVGDLLRHRLIANSWKIMNNTPLPVICFSDEKYESDPNFSQSILNKILSAKKSWISVYPIKGIPSFRACITNYNTSEKEIDELIQELNSERTYYANSL